MKTHAEARGQPMTGGGSPRLACEQPGSALAQLRLAFGLLLDVDPRIPLAGLAPAGRATGRESATSVKIDPQGLAQRWSALRAPPRRARELRGPDGAAVLTVDFADPA